MLRFVWQATRTLVVSPIGLTAFLVLLAFTGCGKDGGTGALAAQGGAKIKTPLPAPDLTGGIAWLNTAKPLALPDLKGRVVLLDFWTLCCINCIHTLPDLAKLEAKYPGVLVIIGVHTPKFENEKLTDSIRKAIGRYEIKHPIINDADMKIWRRFGVNSWPTLVLIDPDGNYVGQTSGEGKFELLDEIIGKMVQDYRAKKLLKEGPIDFELVKEHTGALNFPGKVLADAQSNRLFIADSTNHRIVITTLDGKKIAVAGSGTEGLKDGAFTEARFSDPQGMALVGDTLYVADRKNHALRALNLKDQSVKLVAGTGGQDRSGARGAGPLSRQASIAPGTCSIMTTSYSSPWPVTIRSGPLTRPSKLSIPSRAMAVKTSVTGRSPTPPLHNPVV